MGLSSSHFLRLRLLVRISRVINKVRSRHCHETEAEYVPGQTASADLVGKRASSCPHLLLILGIGLRMVMSLSSQN